MLYTQWYNRHHIIIKSDIYIDIRWHTHIYIVYIHVHIYMYNFSWASCSASWGCSSSKKQVGLKHHRWTAGFFHVPKVTPNEDHPTRHWFSASQNLEIFEKLNSCSFVSDDVCLMKRFRYIESKKVKSPIIWVLDSPPRKFELGEASKIGAFLQGMCC